MKIKTNALFFFLFLFSFQRQKTNNFSKDDKNKDDADTLLKQQEQTDTNTVPLDRKSVDHDSQETVYDDDYYDEASLPDGYVPTNHFDTKIQPLAPFTSPSPSFKTTPTRVTTRTTVRPGSNPSTVPVSTTSPDSSTSSPPPPSTTTLSASTKTTVTMAPTTSRTRIPTSPRAPLYHSTSSPSASSSSSSIPPRRSFVPGPFPPFRQGAKVKEVTGSRPSTGGASQSSHKPSGGDTTLTSLNDQSVYLAPQDNEIADSSNVKNNVPPNVNEPNNKIESDNQDGVHMPRLNLGKKKKTITIL